MAAALKRAQPGCRVTLLCRTATGVIGERCPKIDLTVTIDNEDGTPMSVRELGKSLKCGGFDCAILAHPDWKMAWAAFLAGIPVRIGTGYRLYSFLFNKRHYERRKSSLKHEVELNLGLLEPLGIGFEQPEFHFDLTVMDVNQALLALQEAGVDVEQPYCVIHPGSGGSGLNWSADNYAKAASLFVREMSLKVVVTWGAGEENLARSVKRNSTGVFPLKRVYPLPVIMALLQDAKFLLAPSTGILHLATLAGTPILGLYSPVPHESPRRWRPYRENHVTLTPDEKSCPFCKGGPCKKMGCMNLISPQKVCEIIRHYLLNEEINP
jgi:heptosyltransferase-2